MTDLVKCRCPLCEGGFSLTPDRVGKVMECPHCHEKARFNAAEDKPSIPAPPAQVGGEVTFFNDGGLAVTLTRFVAGVQTFAMSGITSVRMAKTNPGMGVGAFVIAVGAVCFLAATGAWAYSRLFSILAGALGVGLVIGGAKLERNQKPTFHVILSTSGGEVKAYSSGDVEFVARLTGALNNAIVARG